MFKRNGILNVVKKEDGWNPFLFAIKASSTTMRDGKTGHYSSYQSERKQSPTRGFSIAKDITVVRRYQDVKIRQLLDGKLTQFLLLDARTKSTLIEPFLSNNSIFSLMTTNSKSLLRGYG